MHRESFEHLYEEGASFEELLEAVLTVEEALHELQKPLKEKDSKVSNLLTRRRMNPRIKNTNPWGWARTGMEPEVLVYVNDYPLDAILDLGCNASFIDQEISDDLPVKLVPLDCTVSQCVDLGISPFKVLNSVFQVIGWVEIELGVLDLGCLPARLWVTKSMFHKGVPMVLGCHMIKKVFAQANLERIDCWQQPWRFIYEGNRNGQWCMEQLSDTDSSFEVLDHLRSSTPSEEEQIKEAERQIAQSDSTALKGIPGPLEEPDGKEDLTPAAPKSLPLPEEVEEPSVRDDDEQSVFASLAQRLDESAAEAESSPCNSKVIAQAALSSVRLPPFLAVSCKITPTGETIFSLQLEQK